MLLLIALFVHLNLLLSKVKFFCVSFDHCVCEKTTNLFYAMELMNFLCCKWNWFNWELNKWVWLMSFLWQSVICIIFAAKECTVIPPLYIPQVKLMHFISTSTAHLVLISLSIWISLLCDLLPSIGLFQLHMQFEYWIIYILASIPRFCDQDWMLQLFKILMDWN